MTKSRTNPNAARWGRCALVIAVLAGFFAIGVRRNSANAQKKTAAKKSVATKTASSKTTSAKPKKKTEKKPGILGRLIRNIIPKKPPNRIIPKQRVKIPVDPKDDKRTASELIRARDHIDSRAPHDPDDIKRLQRAEALIKVGEWQAAIRLLQFLLDRQNDSLIRNPQEKWVSVREEANHILGRVPKEIRDTYQLKYGVAAKQLLAESNHSSDERTLAEVATRYFHTKAGVNAARRLCLMAMERGDYGIAARWFARVEESNDPSVRDPQWLLQAAYAFRRSGDLEESERLLKRVEAAVGTGTMNVAGQSIRPADWLRKFEPVESGSRVVEEWWTAYGTPSRTGTVKGGEPLLLSRWAHPTTQSHSVRKQLENVTQALNDIQRAQIPAAVPLTVNGKVIFRTLRGVLVVDADSGKSLWETREGVSAERILGGRPPSSSRYSRFRGGGLVVNRFGRSSSTSKPGDYHPLTGLLYRNGVYGMLSSDGKQLFVIEDQALLPNVNSGYSYNSDPERNDPYRRSWMTNKLTAYDLETGRPSWEVGGRDRKESFDLPLAGNYFFGVPVAQDGELFLIGERDSRIRLHVLDAKTGKPKWSRLIAYSDTKISSDSVRRWFVAQPTIKEGVVICPTGVGWMVAVDRTNQSILWAHRYAKPRATTSHNHAPGRNTLNVRATALNSRWLPSAPVIAAGHVIYTPQEEPAIICVRLRDGKQIWRIPKNDLLYLAGVFQERVVLVGQKNVTAIKLRSGTTDWTQPLDTKNGKPSGMGVAVDNHYHLPLQSGQLWTLDLATGKVDSKMYLPKGNSPLGNLTMYRGQVLSATAFAMTSFEQRAALMTRIRKRQTNAPNDAWAALKQAEISLLRRDFANALKALRRIKSDELPQPSQARYRQAMVNSLTAVIRSDFKNHDDAVSELKSFAKSADDQFALQRLQAERFDARGDFAAAFALYQQLANENGTRRIHREDNSRLELTVEAWVTGKLRDLWKRIPPELQKTLNTKLKADAEKLAGQPLDLQVRFSERFAFHPVSAVVIKRLADRFAADGKFGQAEQMLMQLQKHSDPQIAAQATEQLARLLLSQQLTSDSRYVYHQLRHRYPEAILSNGKTAAAHVTELETRKIIPRNTKRQQKSWGTAPLTIQESGTQYQSQPSQELIVDSSPYPYFQEHGFQIDHSAQQLLVSRSADQELSWLVPLRARLGSPTGNYDFATTFGHQILLRHRDILHCLSPVDRRVLWTKSLGTELQTRRHYFSYYSSSPLNQIRTQSMQGGKSVGNLLSLGRKAALIGAFAFANESYIGLQGKRQLVVLNARTGETVWRYRGVAENSHIVGTSDTVFIIPQDGSEVTALRTIDGRPVTGKALSIVKAAAAVVGNRFLVADVNTKSFLGFSRSTTTWKLQDPLTGHVTWKRAYGTGTSFSILDDGNLAALKKHGQLEIVNRENGQVKTVNIPGKEVEKADIVYLMADQATLFVIANSGRTRNYYNNGGLSTVPVNGIVHAVDRRSGKTRWSQKIQGDNLVIDQFGQSPLLVFTTRKYINKGLIRHMSISLKVFDKATGKSMMDSQRASNQYYGTFQVNLPERYVEFRTYSSRLRLMAGSAADEAKSNEAAKSASPARKPAVTTN